MGRQSQGPLDDQPSRAIEARRRAVSGFVERRPPKARVERDEAPSPEDIERFSDVTVVCPHCKATLHDDVDVCWSCGVALLAPRKSSLVAPIVAAILIVAILLGTFAGLVFF